MDIYNLKTVMLLSLSVVVAFHFILTFYLVIKSNDNTLSIKISVLMLMITSFILLLQLFNHQETIEYNETEILNNIKETIAAENPRQFYLPKNVDYQNEPTQEFSKESALDSLTYIFRLFREDNLTSDDIKEDFDKLANNDNEFHNVVTDEALNKLYLTDILRDDMVSINTSLILMSLNAQISTNDYVEPDLINLDLIYLDEYTKTAHIPLEVYTGTTTMSSVPLVFVDNEWKIAPYSLIETVQVYSLLEELK